jgi:hypothetical protein
LFSLYPEQVREWEAVCGDTTMDASIYERKQELPLAAGRVKDSRTTEPSLDNLAPFDEPVCPLTGSEDCPDRSCWLTT